jgi:cytochrome c oxidase subunit 2
MRVMVGAALTVALTIGSVAVLVVDPGRAAVASPNEALVFVSNGCNGCHKFGDVPGNAQIGPDLTNVEAVAGNRVPGLSTEEYIRQSVTEPQAYIVPGFGPQMPTLPLTPNEVEELISLLGGADKSGRLSTGSSRDRHGGTSPRGGSEGRHTKAQMAPWLFAGGSRGDRTHNLRVKGPRRLISACIFG